MTGKLDAGARKVAVNAISKFGKAITLIRVTEGTYNPATGKTTNSEASSTINCVVEEYKGYDFANNLAMQGDKKLTVAASGLTVPSLADKVTIDSLTFSILDVQTIYSGELPCLYVIQARKN